MMLGVVGGSDSHEENTKIFRKEVKKWRKRATGKEEVVLDVNG